MSAKKPTEKNTKPEILQAYEELAKEQASLKNQLEQAHKESQTVSKERPKVEAQTEPKIAMIQPNSMYSAKNE
jgi:predicted  nucleic acid-binding Zn-ribbon protein